jgi:hypothetical protein
MRVDEVIKKVDAGIDVKTCVSLIVSLLTSLLGPYLYPVLKNYNQVRLEFYLQAK